MHPRASPGLVSLESPSPGRGGLSRLSRAPDVRAPEIQKIKDVFGPWPALCATFATSHRTEMESPRQDGVYENSHHPRCLPARPFHRHARLRASALPGLEGAQILGASLARECSCRTAGARWQDAALDLAGLGIRVQTVSGALARLF